MAKPLTVRRVLEAHDSRAHDPFVKTPLPVAPPKVRNKASVAAVLRKMGLPTDIPVTPEAEKQLLAATTRKRRKR